MLKWDEKRSNNSIASQPLNCDMRFWNTRNEKQIATNVKVKRETRKRNTKRETGNAKRLTRDATQQMPKWDEKCITVQLWNTLNKKQITVQQMPKWNEKRERETRNEKRNTRNKNSAPAQSVKVERETHYAQQETNCNTKQQQSSPNNIIAFMGKHLLIRLHHAPLL